MNPESYCIPRRHKLLGQTTEQLLSNFEPQNPWKYKQLWGLRHDLSCYKKIVYIFYLIPLFNKTPCLLIQKSIHILNIHLLAQGQQGKHQKNVWKLFKVNYRDTKTTLWTLLVWYFHRWFWTSKCRRWEGTIIGYIVTWGITLLQSQKSSTGQSFLLNI